MDVFCDLEFIENGPLIPIKLISIGLVAQDGRELYVINEECLSGVMNNNWLYTNVRPSLPIQEDQATVGGGIYQWDPNHEDYPAVLPLGVLVQRVAEFLLDIAQGPDGLKLWGYYSAYDHVVLMQHVFGKMADLPAGIPMWTRDLMQLAEDLYGPAGMSLLPPQPTTAHNALHDARWNRDAYLALTGGGTEEKEGRHASRHAAD